ncbi:MAG TPA: glycosyltransferase family 2 protein [Patescibacteria group bacterium]|nr:glycosyltransferase family 2 protein [Patescibacteria group bacterium]
MNIFIVIPFFNEQSRIVKVLKEIQAYQFPIVVVNDGSRDDSKAEIRGSKLKGVTLLEHKVNLGKGAALKTGAEYAFNRGAGAVIFMDADGQHEAEDLPKFVKALITKKYDVVFGSRNFGYGVPFVRYIGNKVASVLIALLFGIYVSDIICGFRALSRKAYKKIKWESSGYGVETEMVIRVGKSKLRYCEIPVETLYHDKVKGVTILDALGIFGEVIKWKLTIK